MVALRQATVVGILSRFAYLRTTSLMTPTPPNTRAHIPSALGNTGRFTTSPIQEVLTVGRGDQTRRVHALGADSALGEERLHREPE